MKKTAILCGLVLGLLVLPLFAQDGPPPDRRAKILEKFDEDGDGTLSDAEKAKMREEMEKRRAEHRGDRPTKEEILKKFDEDGDGKLSDAEKEKMKEQLRERGHRRRGGRHGGGEDAR